MAIRVSWRPFWLTTQNMGRQKFGIRFESVIDTILWVQPGLDILQPHRRPPGLYLETP